MSVLKRVSHCDWKLLYISRIWASIQEERFPPLGASEGLSNIAAVSLSLSLHPSGLDAAADVVVFFLPSFKWLAASCPPVCLNEALFLGSDIIAFGFPLSRREPCSSFQSLLFPKVPLGNTSIWVLLYQCSWLSFTDRVKATFDVAFLSSWPPYCTLVLKTLNSLS